MSQPGKSPRPRRLYGWIGLLTVLMLIAAACQRTTPPTEMPTEPPEMPPLITEAVEPTAVEATEGVAAPEDELAARLMQQQWVLVAFGEAANPLVVEQGTTVTALFDADGMLSGSGGCNNYSTSYVLDGDMLSVSEIASTMMACERGMEQEAAVLAALRAAQRIAFSDEGRLQIFYDMGTGEERVMVFTSGAPALTNTVWVLESMGAPGAPYTMERGIVITALFDDDGRLSGSAGCNNYFSGYTAEDGALSIDMPGSTLMACARGMEQEAAFLAALASAESYTIAGPRLEIGYNAGQGLMIFTSQNLTLENVVWTLVTVNGEPNTAGLVPTTVLFDPGAEPLSGAVGGTAMCNNFRGGYSLTETGLELGPIATTLIRCPETVAQAEAMFMDLLQTAESYEVQGQTLTLLSPNGALAFEANRAPLEGTFWRLDAMGPIDEPVAPVPGGNYTALFLRTPEVVSGSMIGNTGCNDYSAAYTANVEEMRVNPPLRSNNPGCTPGLPEQEAQYFQALNAATRYRILADRLQIFYGENKMLTYTAFVPEPEPPAAGPLSVLNGTQWWLVSMGNSAVLPGSQVTAQFAIEADGLTGAVSGSAGCNTYNAPLTGALQIGAAVTTKMLCAEPAGVMEQESSYLAMLSTANSFSLAYNQLVIGTAGGLLVYYNSPNPVVPVTPEPTSELPATPTPEATTPAPEQTEPPAETETPAVTEAPPVNTPEATEVVTPEPTEAPTLAPTAPPAETPGPAPDAPMAKITAPPETSAGQPVTFDASGSTGPAEITGFTWSFSDGYLEAGETVVHTFMTPGVYTVTLTVVDANGKVATATHTITVI